MLQGGRDLVLEFLTVDGRPAAPGPGGISSLEHEIGYYTVEEEIVVVAAAGEGLEVFTGLVGYLAGCQMVDWYRRGVGYLWSVVGVEFYYNRAL